TDQPKTELTLTFDGRAKDDNEAKINSLIEELDALISSINAAHDDGAAPARFKEEVLELKTQDELKLVEAIELAYSEALLLKEGDDKQPEKDREAKIKQI